jgi:hypothetical protein
MNSNTLFAICILSCPVFYLNASKYFLDIWFAIFVCSLNYFYFFATFGSKKFVVGASNDL